MSNISFCWSIVFTALEVTFHAQFSNANCYFSFHSSIAATVINWILVSPLIFFTACNASSFVISISLELLVNALYQRELGKFGISFAVKCLLDLTLAPLITKLICSSLKNEWWHGQYLRITVCMQAGTMFAQQKNELKLVYAYGKRD